MTVSEKSVQTTGESSPDNNKEKEKEKEDSVGLKTFKSLAIIPTYSSVKPFSSKDNPSVLRKVSSFYKKKNFFFSYLLINHFT